MMKNDIFGGFRPCAAVDQTAGLVPKQEFNVSDGLLHMRYRA